MKMWRAARPWRNRARRPAARAARRQVFSVALVVAGAAGALAGGWLVARWCLGVTLMAESALISGWGLFRDDGQVASRPGEKTLDDVLEEAWRRP